MRGRGTPQSPARRQSSLLLLTDPRRGTVRGHLDMLFGSYSSGWPRHLWSTQVSGHGDARVVVRVVALAPLEVPCLAICGLSVPCSRGPHHQATASGRGSPVSHLNTDPAQTLGPGQGAYAGVSTCLTKKQAHESQPCNYSTGQDAGPWSWYLVFKRYSIRM